MSLEQIQRELAATGCEIALDNLTRQLYATDASIYQVVPLAVAFPRSAAQAAAVIKVAAAANVPVTPRGSGTGLTGGAVGSGVVIDFARHNRQIHALNREAPSVLCGAGVVLDSLNSFLQPHGLAFGPDVATSSRATLGGMISNNSSGARVPIYGVTGDHVLALEVVLADGTIARIGSGDSQLQHLGHVMGELIPKHAAEIARRFPPGLAKRWPGYGIERFLNRRACLTELVSGSEGTLAGIWAAELKAVHLPREKALGLVFFASIAEAMQATVELLDLKPAAIEHLDRILLDQTRGQGAFAAARSLMDLDAQPCESVLVVEFYEDVQERLAALAARRLGLRTTAVTAAGEMDLVWNLRKAGLSLLQSCPGRAKPMEGIEDAAVLPAHLPAYVAGLQKILGRLGLQASFYGHAASGLLHVRPVLDLHLAGDVAKYRQLAGEVSALVLQFKGSLAAEHGLGMARTQYLEEQIGSELVAVMREVKHAFDPGDVFNPGKIVGDGRFTIDGNLRFPSGKEAPLPFSPVLAFAPRDGSFSANLEQCNGCGGCRKEVPTMCPTFLATGQEIMSTRGRTNTLRAVLEGRAGGSDPLASEELEAALSDCLSCKACLRECPSNVNFSLLKAELLNARWRRDGLGLREWMVSSVDILGRVGTAMPDLANTAMGWPWVKRILEQAAGFSARRTMPKYADERFDIWFERRSSARPASRGRVVLWDDTFVRYNDPGIGHAAVKVLEAAGFEVVLPRGRKCCGRPAFSQGNLEAAARMGRHNLALLTGLEVDAPILFLEPSCWSMLFEDYRELKLDGAEAVAARCFLFEDFLERLLAREPEALRFVPKKEAVAIHAHCHAKALGDPARLARLARRLPGREVALMNTGCCGMAGAYGMSADKYELSLKVGEPLKEQIMRQPAGAVVIATGTSCRHQISDLTPTKPMHIAELLAEALA